MASGIVEPSGSQEQKKQEEQQRQLPARQRLVHRLLAGTPNLPAFMNDLVTAQAMVVAGTEGCAFLVEPAEEGQFALKLLAHVRPDDAPQDVRQQAIQAFAEIVKPCIAQGKDGAIRIEGTGAGETHPQFCLVTLLRDNNNIVAVSAVIARCQDEERARQRLNSMELIAGFFEMFSLKRRAEQAQEIAVRHQHVLQYGSSVATAEGFKAAAMNLCNELASHTGASRVSIGWVKGSVLTPKVKLQGMSHTEQFDRKQELSVQIEKVMEECLDNQEIVRYEPDGTGSQNVAREAMNLSRINGGEQVVSLPLRRRGEIQGVITLEYAPEKKLEQNEATALAVAVELLGPVLYDRYQNDRWLITKAGISARETSKIILGRTHMLAKAIVVVVLLLVWVLCGAYVPFGNQLFGKEWLVLPMYRIAAKFDFQPSEKRTISVPFEGVLEEVLAKPGDPVKKGVVLARMRTLDLQKQLWEAQSRAAAAEARANKASGENKEADRIVALRERDAALADVGLKRYQIEEVATVRAPIDGVVLTGDLKEKQGQSVKQGDQLFELGQLDKLRAELAVNERDVQDIAPEQMVWLATNSDPNDPHKAVVDRIVPMGATKEGANTFKVYASIDPSEIQPDWRPGMAGEARVEIAERTLMWQYTHRFINYLRLKAWSWLP